MPMIYRRFTEKTAEEWRQIYKSLQLLEFLIKHGSERVIDDARSHLTLLKMLRQFHYIDENGKDQGINVRNRAKELSELLSDVDRIRTERKKARATKNKYIGVEGGSGFGSGMSGGSRYGGFGSDSYGGYSGGVFGDGGGFGGQSSEYAGYGGGGGGGSSSNQFDEYDEFDENERPSASSSRPRPSERASASPKKPAEPPKKKEPEVDLFSFDDPEPAPSTAAAVPAPATSSGLADLAAPNNAADDDDFDDFQSAAPAPSAQPLAPSIAPAAAAAPLSPPIAPTASSQFAAPKPVSAPQQANLTNMVNLSSLSPASSSANTPAANYSAFAPPTAGQAAQQPPKPAGFQATGPNYFQSVQATAIPQQSTGGTTMSALKPASTSSSSGAAKKPAAGGDAFGALWSQASSGLRKTDAPSSGPALGQLAKEKSAAGIWGAPAGQSAPRQQQQQQQQGGSAMDDLLG